MILVWYLWSWIFNKCISKYFNIIKAYMRVHIVIICSIIHGFSMTWGIDMAVVSYRYLSSSPSDEDSVCTMRSAAFGSLEKKNISSKLNVQISRTKRKRHAKLHICPLIPLGELAAQCPRITLWAYTADKLYEWFCLAHRKEKARGLKWPRDAR